MSRWIRMCDRLTLDRQSIKRAIACKDEQGETPSLLVHVAATHAAIVNGNRRMYRPDFMQQDAGSWLPKHEYARPVLIGHDEQGQVLGRVREAKYVDESWKYAADFPILKDSVFYRRDGKKLPLFKTVDWIVDNLVPLDDYTGLGYIDLGLQITNPEAIRKVLADEYLTVSVGFKTDSAICSICKQDWAVDDRCEHKLGEVVDGKSMFLISGHFRYEEVSFINFPADPFASTLSKKKLADSLEKMFFLGLPVHKQLDAVSAGLKMTDSLYDADIHVTYENPMAQTIIDLSKIDLNQFTEDMKAPELKPEKAQEMKTALQNWTPETDELKTKRRSLFSTLNARMRKNGWDQAIPASETDVVTEMAQALEQKDGSGEAGKAGDCNCGGECEPCADRAWGSYQYINDEERSFFEDADGLYEELALEIDSAVTAGELPEGAKDDKLTGGERKKLSKSTFCGPNRSFPVNNCSHVTAARRLIGRSKVSEATKAGILACVSRKAKSMGCGGEKSQDFRAVFAKVLKQIDAQQGSQPAEIVETYEELHGHYVNADDDLRMKMRMLHGALHDHWFTTSHLEASKTKLLNTGHEASVPQGRDGRGDRVQGLVDKLKLGDGLAKDALELINKLDSAFDNSEPATQNMIMNAVSALLSEWNGDQYLEFMKKQLAEERDMVVLPKSELTEKDEAINSFAEEKAALDGHLQAERSKAEIFFKDSKKSLATSIVMFKVLRGHDGFRGLDPQQTQAKITELSKRNVVSLKDSVADIVSELKWQTTAPGEIEADPKREEALTHAAGSEQTVNDNAQVDETAAQLSPEDTQRARTEKVQRDQMKIRSMLQYMTAHEQAVFLADVRHGRVTI